MSSLNGIKNFVSTDGLTLPSGADPEQYHIRSDNIAVDIGTINGAIVWGEHSAFVTVKSGGDNSYVYCFYSDRNFVSLDAGNNLISLYDESSNKNYSMIILGKGNDIVYDRGNAFYRYADGDGDDSIYFNDSKSKIIQITSGTISNIERDNSDVILKIGAGSIRLNNWTNGSLLIRDADDNVFSLQADGSGISTVAVDAAGVNYIDRMTLDGNAINYGSEVLINGDDDDNTLSNCAFNVTLTGGKGDDVISLRGSEQTIKYAPNDGNDTIYGVGSNDRLLIAESPFDTVVDGNDVVVKVDTGSITLKNAVGKNVRVAVDALEEGDSLSHGVVFNPKKPSTITVGAPFTGIIDAAKFSDKVTLIDASSNNKAVALCGLSKAGSLKAGTGDSTLIGDAKDDKLYGNSGEDTFVYTVGNGKDALFNVEAKDIISIDGATI